ncbi:hypothetical protein OSTOST_08025 [Ostertagia ostertagi]
MSSRTSCINTTLAASLASSSSTPSERNGHTASATNQLIMHRYKAKSSQLQSPVSSKRTMANDVHCAQPGTSKDSSSGENGGVHHDRRPIIILAAREGLDHCTYFRAVNTEIRPKMEEDESGQTDQ